MKRIIMITFLLVNSLIISDCSIIGTGIGLSIDKLDHGRKIISENIDKYEFSLGDKIVIGMIDNTVIKGQFLEKFIHADSESTEQMIIRINTDRDVMNINFKGIRYIEVSDNFNTTKALFICGLMADMAIFYLIYHTWPIIID
jgi:hypothetical protein